ncbi:Pimeloyl-ACP methyl ester carboxylesterase [Halogranum gelatinilyticum]|uniref:Pimeloyl-ACP methyl ester carboxylesterase n=1 Tax=Halogranum gelatinilyticum TaxID=660521 RepID=A0A1G9VPE9_9EURY|nr:alpha/beta hydrolase [Halogranum gelatinilyticum]SDM73953.1 Pimeloyl-ACP methyl ester carboxylesterase [Halogranum gelatinilyticum]
MPFVQTGDSRTYYEQRGDGPPVVFVHAAILDHSLWDAQAEALADEYTTVVYDLRGHGRTGGSTREQYAVELLADDLHALVTGLGLDRPVVCGLSLGGLVAQSYAARYPDDLSGLVLADTFTPPILSRGEWFLRRVVLNALVYPVRLVGYERVEKANVWLTERVFRGSGGDYEQIEQLRATGPKMTTDEFAKVIHSMTRFHEERVDLAAIAVPTLVLYGEHELPFVRHHAAELAARLRDVAVDVIPDAGHASNLDAPDEFTDTVRRFLRERVALYEASE